MVSIDSPKDPLLKYKALLAPMEGVMNPWFLKVCSRLDLTDHWITPFFSVTGGAVPSRRIIRKRLAPFLESGKQVTVQILGKDPLNVVKCAVHIAETGLSCGINLNFACPSTTVTGNGAGSALLEQPDTVEKIIVAVRNELPQTMPLSVKLRAGCSKPAVRDVIQAAINGGAGVILFHFRTKDEMYHPVPDGWARIRQAVTAAGNIPVYGNGDIRTEEDAERMCSECGCYGVAAARIFPADPLLIRRLNGIPDDRKIDFPQEMRNDGAPEPTVRAVERLIRSVREKERG